jgi:4-aminobutyrate aminotransferase-like enzyme
MLHNAREIEARLRELSADINGVLSIKGKGCLLGIEFDGACQPRHARLLERKIITGTSSDPNVLRLLPPLCLPVTEVERLAEVLNES